MILHQIQRQLEALYQTDIQANVEDFLVRSFKKEGRQESLFVRYSSESLEVGLFIAPTILKTLAKYNPFASLGRQNLKAFLIATEGVSHFVYLLKRTRESNPLTRLELELQAEIDKYLLTCFLFTFHRQKIPSFFFSYLFENLAWRSSLTSEEKGRYIEANRLATKFCAGLDQKLQHAAWGHLLETVRHFYRLSHWDKIRYLTP